MTPGKASFIILIIVTCTRGCYQRPGLDANERRGTFFSRTSWASARRNVVMSQSVYGINLGRLRRPCPLAAARGSTWPLRGRNIPPIPDTPRPRQPGQTTMLYPSYGQKGGQAGDMDNLQASYPHPQPSHPSCPQQPATI